MVWQSVLADFSLAINGNRFAMDSANFFETEKRSLVKPLLSKLHFVVALMVVVFAGQHIFAQEFKSPVRPQSGTTQQPVIQQPAVQQPALNTQTNQQQKTAQVNQGSQTKTGLELPSQFDQERAFQHLVSICEIGPRVSASPGMRKQQKYINAYFTKHFKPDGAKFYSQPFTVRSPYNLNRRVELQNIIIQFHPERKKRLLLCCHHDTRPFADADRANPRAKFIGANDGASGVALLLEMGMHLQEMDGTLGVDLIFFDGEEFVIQRQRDPMFLGSTHFSNEYAAGKIGWKYEYGLLVDMIGDKDLQIYYEGNSLGFADQLTRGIWTVANELGVKEFIPQKRHQIRDDHLPLNSIAGIQTVDIIDFDYPNPKMGNQYWHTRNDVVKNCSADSLGKVGKVVLEWLRRVQKLNKAK